MPANNPMVSARSRWGEVERRHKEVSSRGKSEGEGGWGDMGGEMGRGNEGGEMGRGNGGGEIWEGNGGGGLGGGGRKAKAIGVNIDVA